MSRYAVGALGILRRISFVCLYNRSRILDTDGARSSRSIGQRPDGRAANHRTRVSGVSPKLLKNQVVFTQTRGRGGVCTVLVVWQAAGHSAVRPGSRRCGVLPSLSRYRQVSSVSRRPESWLARSTGRAKPLGASDLLDIPEESRLLLLQRTNQPCNPPYCSRPRGSQALIGKMHAVGCRDAEGLGRGIKLQQLACCKEPDVFELPIDIHGS